MAIPWGSGAVIEEDPARLVDGVCCVRDHFNDPRALYCTICGISMLQQTARLVRRPRPPLGVLVWDDGATTSLRDDLVIGRHPFGHELVTTGQATPVEMTDGADRLSRAHLAVFLTGWDVEVMDLRTTNGTAVVSGSTGATARLQPEVRCPLADDDTVWLGARSFIFQSHHLG